MTFKQACASVRRTYVEYNLPDWTELDNINMIIRCDITDYEALKHAEQRSLDTSTNDQQTSLGNERPAADHRVNANGSSGLPGSSSTCGAPGSSKPRSAVGTEQTTLDVDDTEHATLGVGDVAMLMQLTRSKHNADDDDDDDDDDDGNCFLSDLPWELCAAVELIGTTRQTDAIRVWGSLLFSAP